VRLERQRRWIVLEAQQGVRDFVMRGGLIAEVVPGLWVAGLLRLKPGADLVGCP